MKPISNDLTNHTLGKPQNWDDAKHGPCGGLPVCAFTEDGLPQFYSWWRTTWRERLLILCGRPLRLGLTSRAHPPVSLDLLH